MKTTTMKQRAKVGGSGSFFNQLMSNNSSLPVVGKGATQMHYSDRDCFEVVEVSDDLKTVKLEVLNAVADDTKDCMMGHQNWIFKPTGNFITVVWRHNAWREKFEVVRYNKEYQKKMDGNFRSNKDYVDCYDEHGNLQVVDGVTELKTEYSGKINILFGVKNYYYDWSF